MYTFFFLNIYTALVYFNILGYNQYIYIVYNSGHQMLDGKHIFTGPRSGFFSKQKKTNKNLSLYNSYFDQKN